MAESTSRPVDMADKEVIVARFEDTPVTIQRKTWMPAAQIITWGLFSLAAKKRDPDQTGLRAVLSGFLEMAVTLGSEWGHNLSHLAVSNWIGRPMDQFRIQFGMPRCIYHQLNDRGVTPREHIIRSLGGPIYNLLVLPFAAAASWTAKKDSLLGRIARTALHTNLFLSLVSLLPIPGIDGGPILKWSLVERGCTIPEADEVVRQVNGPLAVGLGLFSSLAFARKKILPGVFAALLGLTSLSVFTGWIKEEEIQV